ncbi:hypothetical protein COCOBI_05-7100 [Coccomyxa sp. Obi]|nr:hypothetical protein COCOBI_05-7100 [Coccomyxa sp. Obi]
MQNIKKNNVPCGVRPQSQDQLKGEHAAPEGAQVQRIRFCSSPCFGKGHSILDLMFWESTRVLKRRIRVGRYFSLLETLVRWCIEAKLRGNEEHRHRGLHYKKVPQTEKLASLTLFTWVRTT